MPESLLSLAVVYQGRDSSQRKLLKALTPLSPDQWALPVATHHWSIQRLVQHMASTRAWWLHGWTGEGGADVASIARWEDEGQPQRSPAELLAGLETTWDMIEQILARWTVADLGDVFNPPTELTEAEREMVGPGTRQELIWHVNQHEIQHAEELKLALGGYHLPMIWGS